MRVLIVNPNTSSGVTRRIAAAADSVAQPGDRFTTVSALSGPRLIVTEADAEAATIGVIQAVRAQSSQFDGIIVASFGDTGADHLRRLYPSPPVIGIAQAAFTAARRLGGRFAIVSFAPEVAPSLVAMAEFHGVSDRVARVATLPGPLQHDPVEIADVLLQPLTDLCIACAVEPVTSIVLGGGPLAGVAARIGPACPVPLIDGTQAAIAQLRERVCPEPRS